MTLSTASDRLSVSSLSNSSVSQSIAPSLALDTALTTQRVQSSASRLASVGDSRVTTVQDFNQDGQTDILWRNYSTGDVGAWLMNGSVIQGWAAMQSSTDPNWRIEATADFNHDGKSDILWRNYSTGVVGIWLMDGANITGWSLRQTNVNLDFHIEGVADFDDDGQLDILWRNYSNGNVGAWLMTGSTIQNWSDMQVSGDLNWQIEGTGDFDNDGRSDILWRNYSTGVVGAWLRTQSGIRWAAMPTVADLNWRIEGTGDFNRDGQVDLLWRNYSNGAVGAWLMTGTSILRWAEMPTVADLNWRPIVSSSLVSVVSGDTIGTARNLGTFTAQVIADSIGGTDRNDYYRFDLTQPLSRFNLTLSGLSVGAGVELLASDGDRIANSFYRGGSPSSSPLGFSRELDAGTYYIRVSPSDNTANYSLSLSAPALILLPDAAGSTKDTARDIGVLTGNRSFQDSVGTKDFDDYYRFELNQDTELTLNFSAVDSSTYVSLIDSDDREVRRLLGGPAGTLIQQLPLMRGTYYVVVTPYSAFGKTLITSTNYTLSLSVASNVPADRVGNSLALVLID